jgi:NAD(P)-dependent dehydrogenase (short-subunit alcohol dehydrogenase family)
MTERVVLVTGALTGIGRATAFAFASEGAKIVLSGRHQDKGDELAAELRRAGAEAEFVKADVRYETDVANLVDKAVSRFGRLDVAVNNAGREGLAPISEVTPEHYNEVFDTNVLGTLLSLKHEFCVMQAQRKGSIVNVSSVYGHIGFGGGGSVYVGSKFAIEGITKSAALEGGPQGIRVNAVAPGPVETSMFRRVIGNNEDVKAMVVGSIPYGRVGEAHEIAAAIVFIASDQASFMTGEIVGIDGGIAAG